MVERYVRDVEVACSNHVTPTFGKRTVKLHEMWLYGFFSIKMRDKAIKVLKNNTFMAF